MKRQRVFLAAALALLMALAASPGFAVGAGNGRAGDPIADSYIIVLQSGVSSEEVAAGHGLARGRSFSAVFNGFSAFVPPGRLGALRGDPRVVSVSANRVITIAAKPDRPPGKDKPGASGQIVPSGVARIGAAPGSLAQTGVGVGVAIVDTGIDLGNGDLAVSPVCFTAYASCQDGNGHGTHVAGIVAALDNTIDVVGVAPGTTPYAVKVLDDTGSGTDETVIAGLDWIVANAGSVNPPIRVANLSLGRPASSDDSALHAAVKAVYDAGIAVVVAAGNDRYAEATDSVPGGFPEAMAVASSTATDGKGSRCGKIVADTASWFTTDGPTILVSAPGEDSENLKGCGVIESVGIVSLRVGGGTTALSGTSMAAPHVAGVVALLWDRADDTGGTLSPAGARSSISGGADRVGVVPLDSIASGYSYDGAREGVLSAPGALAQ